MAAYPSPDWTSAPMKSNCNLSLGESGYSEKTVGPKADSDERPCGREWQPSTLMAQTLGREPASRYSILDNVPLASGTAASDVKCQRPSSAEEMRM
jgi:hypothetical protein